MTTNLPQQTPVQTTAGVDIFEESACHPLLLSVQAGYTRP